MIRERNNIFIGIIILGITLTIAPLSLIYFGDEVLSKWETITFEDPAGESLVGTYYPGSLDMGVMLLEGYAADQTSLKGIGAEFARLGFHVFTFDFSGHGRSFGDMEVIYTQSDKLAKEVIAGKEMFKSISGLVDSQIILFGHSMGARVALQSATFDSNKVSALILFGAQVNLDTNARLGSNQMYNDLKLDWIKSLSTYNPPVSILILTGELDDVLPPYRAELLYQRLGGENSQYVRELVVIDNLIHGYETYSPEAITHTLNWVIKYTDIEIVPYDGVNTLLIRKICWTLSFLGIFLTLIVGNFYIMKKKLKIEKKPQVENLEKDRGFTKGMRINNIKKFLIYKLLIWFAAIPLYIGVLILFLTIPLSNPFIYLLSISSIGGYGILLILLYRSERMPGTNGVFIPKLKFDKKALNRNVLKGFISASLLIVFSTFFAQSGLFYVFPLNDRFLWLIILTIFTIPGLYVMDQELKSFNNSVIKNRKKSYKIVLFSIQIYPFFFLAVWVGSLHGIIILIYVFTAGYLIQNIGKKASLTIIFQAFLLNYLLLSLGVLYPRLF